MWARLDHQKGTADGESCWQDNCSLSLSLSVSLSLSLLSLALLCFCCRLVPRMFCCFAFSQSGGSHSLSDWRLQHHSTVWSQKGGTPVHYQFHGSITCQLVNGTGVPMWIFYQVQIVPLLTLKKSCCQCQIWQKQRCATITFVGPGDTGDTGDTGDGSGDGWKPVLPSVSSAGDATIPSASLPMALVSFDPCGRIPFGPWRPWLPKPFQGP